MDIKGQPTAEPLSLVGSLLQKRNGFHGSLLERTSATYRGRLRHHDSHLLSTKVLEWQRDVFSAVPVIIEKLVEFVEITKGVFYCILRIIHSIMSDRL